MRTLSGTLFLVLLALTACGVDDETELMAPQLSKGKGGGGGGGTSVTYAYTMEGDIFTPAGATAPTLSANATPKFLNISLSNFSVELGAPTGVVGQCRTGNAQYDELAFHPQNLNRTWIGTLKVANNGTLSFLGSSNGETLQFSVADATGGPTQSATGDGVYMFAYTDARLFFGSNSTHYDGKYRCVNLALVATAQ